MSMAIIGAMFIGEWMEAGTVVVLFALAQYMEMRSMERARRSVNSLMDESPKTAHLISKGELNDVPVQNIKPGDQVAVKPGEKIPADGIVLKGHSFVDQATITGESIPIFKNEGEKVYAGTLNKDGYLEILVDRSYDDSTFSRIIHLVVEAQTKKLQSRFSLTGLLNIIHRLFLLWPYLSPLFHRFYLIVLLMSGFTGLWLCS